MAIGQEPIRGQCTWGLVTGIPHLFEHELEMVYAEGYRDTGFKETRKLRHFEELHLVCDACKSIRLKDTYSTPNFVMPAHFGKDGKLYASNDSSVGRAFGWLNEGEQEEITIATIHLANGRKDHYFYGKVEPS